MSKNQKIEWVLSVLVIISFFGTMYSVMQNFDLFGTKEVTIAEIISMTSLAITGVAWIINYLVKIAVSIRTADDGARTPLVWIFGPIIFAIATGALINGTGNFTQGFEFLAVFAGIGIFLTCIAYNVFFCLYFGKRTPMYVALIIYNLAVIIYATTTNTLGFIHNVYLGFFIPATVIGYLEFFIREKIENN